MLRALTQVAARLIHLAKVRVAVRIPSSAPRNSWSGRLFGGRLPRSSLRLPLTLEWVPCGVPERHDWGRPDQARDAQLGGT